VVGGRELLRLRDDGTISDAVHAARAARDRSRGATARRRLTAGTVRPARSRARRRAPRGAPRTARAGAAAARARRGRHRSRARHGAPAAPRAAAPRPPVIPSASREMKAVEPRQLRGRSRASRRAAARGEHPRNEPAREPDRGRRRASARPPPLRAGREPAEPPGGLPLPIVCRWMARPDLTLPPSAGGSLGADRRRSLRPQRPAPRRALRSG